jgi:hypothetical protein
MRAAGQMTTTQIAWLAGLLEGEGCFRFGGRSSPVIQLQMTDVDVIKRVARSLGVEAKPQPARAGRFGDKVIWRLDIYGDKATEIMRLILPYMGERRTTKIQEVLTGRRKRRAYVMQHGSTIYGGRPRRVVRRNGRHTIQLDCR